MAQGYATKGKEEDTQEVDGWTEWDCARQYLIGRSGEGWPPDVEYSLMKSRGIANKPHNLKTKATLQTSISFPNQKLQYFTNIYTVYHSHKV